MADLDLTPEEIRVLGCLLEKEMATPEYYPLSLKALLNACNQKSNREPVVSYDEDTVHHVLDELKANHLVYQSDAARVPRYGHLLGKTFNLVTRELAVLCLLLLRGPQTMGQLRSRSVRMYSFSDLDEVAETMQSLEEMDLARQMARQPGQKERRFCHLLAEPPAVEDLLRRGAPSDDTGADTMISRSARIAALEEELQTIRRELAELRQAFFDFRQQFE